MGRDDAIAIVLVLTTVERRAPRQAVRYQATLKPDCRIPIMASA